MYEPGKNLPTTALHGWTSARLLHRCDGWKGLGGSGKHLLVSQDNCNYSMLIWYMNSNPVPSGTGETCAEVDCFLPTRSISDNCLTLLLHFLTIWGSLRNAFRNAHRPEVFLHAYLKVLKMDLLAFGREGR